MRCSEGSGHFRTWRSGTGTSTARIDSAALVDLFPSAHALWPRPMALRRARLLTVHPWAVSALLVGRQGWRFSPAI